MSNDDQDFIAAALPTFINEAEEQVERLEQLLLELEASPGDRELLDALFRCAHTVKGSAGLFGLDALVGFTHHVETLLDHVREGRRALDGAVSTLLLQCNDQMRRLVAVAGSAEPDDPEGQPEREALQLRLRDAGVPATAPTPTLTPLPVSLTPAGERLWHVWVRFGAEVLRNGMDPLALLNYLQTLGRLEHVVCDRAAVPALDALDAESCHLAFEFGLRTAAGREEIEAAFSFVREDCELHLVEPDAGPEQFIALIQSLPQHPRLGDILVAAGAISQAQLHAALAEQERSRATGAPAAPLGKILTEKAGVSAAVVDAALQKQARQTEGGEDQRFIRVQADRLDAVINLLGELVIAGAGATELARQTRQSALVQANDQIGGLIEEIRNATLQLRMVPIGESFARFRRVVRDTAAEVGKDVQLEIQGGETELDKSMVERIADPLMHLVRNALDHGLETPEQRGAAGKRPQGRLVLSACHDGGSILIRIDDDGRGIDRERVLQRGWDKGLVERGVVPADADILGLIFEAGFSTAEKITNLSGRGVGMDVVRRNIEALRGSVAITSEQGRGTRIEIRLPLTLAIIDGFLVGVGTSRFIFPLDAVVEVIEGRGAEVAMQADGSGVLSLREEALPVLSLRTLYELDAAPACERSSVVVLQSGARRYGVLVDALLGQHQTVIKPLGRMLRTLRGMSGSSILGNGDVALIFDVEALRRFAEQPAQRSAALAVR
ncbi:two-component system chemotaxis sensor kinase CheA [Pelomonas saccharophila]|uniref:Chemotaxis protein CheA n=1 Tax=Roseateles saccharophilus TaxID=304 RepID=A0ABU1YMN1_ROSSA|nr:chemotaxis protein CheA [Roseateles saccharophilus]MDR7269261.1 two-component system chemotaxis sensor kinase CheA [Roseateles saccharophilus]